MFGYNYFAIALLSLICITDIIRAHYDQPCFVYPLMEIMPNKTVHFATSFKGNFFEASNYCRRHCMHLLSINSIGEQKAIENYLKSSPYKNEEFWTSGNDLADEGVFSWGSTGDRLTYTNWLKNEPNNVVRNHVGENCLHLWSIKNYQWNDLQCSTKYYFICEIRM